MRTDARDMAHLPSPRSARSRFPYVALAIVTLVWALEDTKQALLPRSQSKVLWGAEIATFAALLFLRSGWLRDNRWREEQRRLGTLANNFYEPRRENLIAGFAVGGGVFGGLWWGLATWSTVFLGMRRGVAARGLLDFEVAAACGICVGAAVGAAVGLAVGHVWEDLHRTARRRQREAC